MRYRRNKPALAMGPIICRQCNEPTNRPRQGACVACYDRARRTGEPLRDRRHPAQLALPLARTVWSEFGICRRGA